MEYGIPNQKIYSFRDLYAWQEAHRLVIAIYMLTKKYPKDELFALVSQMRRSAVSVTSNIAEGFSRHSWKEKAQFYAIARGSVTELQSQLDVSKDVGYLSQDAYEAAEARCVSVLKLLHALSKGSRANHRSL